MMNFSSKLLAVNSLLAHIEQVMLNGAVAVESKGLDLQTDMQAIAQGLALYSYIKTEFLPAIKSNPATTNAPSDASQASSAQQPAASTAPGLANVVPA